MQLIVGLGNPGIKYKQTRHNIGFMALDFLSQKANIDNWRMENKFNSLITEVFLGNKKIILAKPQTFMNNSGQAVLQIINYFDIKTENITVIHDDIDIEIGKTKFQTNRESAGHKGVKSIIHYLKTKNFSRIRIGIKPTDKIIENPEIFVVKKFNSKEKKIIKTEIKKAANFLLAADV